MYRPVLPRGVLQIARAAEAAGWQATVLDGYSAPQLLPAYLQALQIDEAEMDARVAFPDLVGISIHGPPSIAPALAIAARLREIEPSLPLVFGGQLANADAELLLPLLPERSVLFCGDGDTAIADVMQEALKATDGARLIRRPGIAPWHSLPDLDLLLPRYSAYFGESDFEYHLETQVGCPYRCFHCGTGRQGLYASTKNRPIDAILSELQQVIMWAQRDNLPHPSLWITDETFGSDTEHTRRFCEALIACKEAWRWRAQSRADIITEELLGLMRAAGCQRVAFGVEIPNDAGLDLLGKREGMKDVLEAFALCHRVGLSPEAIIVVGTPGDSTTPEQFLDALDLLEAGSVQAYIYHPIPGSPWWKKYGTDLREDGDSGFRWSDLDFHSPPLGGSPEDVERAIVSFLALSLWRSDTERSVHAPQSITHHFKCAGCAVKTDIDLLFAHAATQISISRCKLANTFYYIATAPGGIEILEFDPAQHRNLYSGLFQVSRQDLDLACPQCIINATHQERSYQTLLGS